MLTLDISSYDDDPNDRVERLIKVLPKIESSGFAAATKLWTSMNRIDAFVAEIAEMPRHQVPGLLLDLGDDFTLSLTRFSLPGTLLAEARVAYSSQTQPPKIECRSSIQFTTGLWALDSFVMQLKAISAAGSGIAVLEGNANR